jgi:RHS repeat-associated protein
MTHTITAEKLEFGYDYRGFRGWKKVYSNGSNLSQWIGYVYDGNLVTEEIDLLNNKAIIRSYTWGLDPAGTQQQVGGIGALVSMEQDNKNYHVVSDAGGNVTNLIESHTDGSLTMANTYEYGPFGQVVSSEENVEMPYQFNTKYTDDETDLVYYGFRYYDAQNGRWLNQDPIGVDGGINTYNSVSNNMVNGYTGGMGFATGMRRSLGYLGRSLGIDIWGRKEFEMSIVGKSYILPVGNNIGSLKGRTGLPLGGFTAGALLSGYDQNDYFDFMSGAHADTRLKISNEITSLSPAFNNKLPSNDKKDGEYRLFGRFDIKFCSSGDKIKKREYKSIRR